jgi:hypothetical protein
MGKRFDDLSKAFATGISRRQALMGAVGGMGAAVAAAVLPGRGALADDDAARKCASFCVHYCTAQDVIVNGTSLGFRTYLKYCTEQCIAEASMGQGVCFTVNGAPLYARGCHSDKGCPTNLPVCCNGRCCKPELCVAIDADGFFTNGLIFTNGLEEVCLGCPQAV